MPKSTSSSTLHKLEGLFEAALFETHRKALTDKTQEAVDEARKKKKSRVTMRLWIYVPKKSQEKKMMTL